MKIKKIELKLNCCLKSHLSISCILMQILFACDGGPYEHMQFPVERIAS